MKVLEEMKEMDRAYAMKIAEEHGSISFCAECHKFTATGLYPFWHRFARVLCQGCGTEYSGLLKNMRAVDTF